MSSNERVEELATCAPFLAVPFVAPSMAASNKSYTLLARSSDVLPNIFNASFAALVAP